jgi:hypothetical protein
MIRFQSAKTLQRNGLDSFPSLRRLRPKGAGWNVPRKNRCDHVTVCVWTVRYLYDICDHVIMINPDSFISFHISPTVSYTVYSTTSGYLQMSFSRDSLFYHLDACLCPCPRELDSAEQAGAGRTVPHGRHGRIIVLDDSDQGTSRSGEVLTVFTGSPEHNSIRPALRCWRGHF